MKQIYWIKEFGRYHFFKELKTRDAFLKSLGEIYSKYAICGETIVRKENVK